MTIYGSLDKELSESEAFIGNAGAENEVWKSKEACRKARLVVLE